MTNRGDYLDLPALETTGGRFRDLIHEIKWGNMLRPKAILETVLCANDLQKTVSFYKDVLSLEPIYADKRMAALRVSDENFLLLFKASGTTEPIEVGDGTIPSHDGSGPIHVAFSVSPSDMQFWVGRLRSRGLAIESTVNWPSGQKSIYFRDPDEHLVELATPDLWVSKTGDGQTDDNERAR